MKSTDTNLRQIAVNQVVSRYTFLIVLRTTLEAKSYRFAREIAQDWVKLYPGDIEVSFLLAKAFIGEGDHQKAIDLLKNVCLHDPEYYEAMETLALLMAGVSDNQLEPLVMINALTDLPKAPASMPQWGSSFKTAWKAFKDGKLDEALPLVQGLVQTHPTFLGGAVLLVRILAAKKDQNNLFQQAKVFHQKWPDCVSISLLLAECKMNIGQEADAVNLLHECVANDAAGQTAQRIWGAGHPYSPLWVDHFDFRFSYAVPASVAELFGWNYLPAGQVSSDTSKKGAKDDSAVSFGSQTTGIGSGDTLQDSLRSVEDAFNSLAGRISGATYQRDEGRFPVYVVMSCRGGLVKQYGQQTALVIESAMRLLAEAVAGRKGWTAMVYIVDDPNVQSNYGISPVDAIDPWKIKLAIKDLDTALARKGEKIGALIIVGGPDIIPFHRLPNPTDDDDVEVPSDGPYSTLDDNYFVPAWQVGRVAGESGPDSALLLGQLHRMTTYHTQLQRLTSAPSWVEILFRLLDRLKVGVKKAKRIKTTNFGITAAVWRKASINVYNPLGGSGDLLVCPPDQSGTYPASKVSDAGLAYANLHGTEDGPDWYGQRDAQVSPDGPDYPVAITPSLLQNNGHAPKMVFSEACYGANIVQKKEQDSMALRFMGIGSMVFVGSTTIAYGAVDTPLVGADIIGSYFWKALKDGSTAGEAFVKAKLELAQEMNSRQGFLDGEDQKTLISFILLGDPLVTLDASQKNKKEFKVIKQIPYRILSDIKKDDYPSHPVTEELLSEIKGIVNGYLPGLEEAQYKVRSQYDPYETQADDHAVDDDAKSIKEVPGQYKINFSKSVRTTSRTHRHFARATINHEGKLVKLVISR